MRENPGAYGDLCVSLRPVRGVLNRRDPSQQLTLP